MWNLKLLHQLVLHIIFCLYSSLIWIWICCINIYLISAFIDTPFTLSELVSSFKISQFYWIKANSPIILHFLSLLDFIIPSDKDWLSDDLSFFVKYEVLVKSNLSIYKEMVWIVLSFWNTAKKFVRLYFPFSKVPLILLTVDLLDN